jgi:dihydrodipicolinate synthase/N-acetylneuraminate lyase
MAFYALSDPSLGATKLAMKKLGLPVSPTVRRPALPAPEESEGEIEAALKTIGLLPTKREA